MRSVLNKYVRPALRSRWAGRLRLGATIAVVSLIGTVVGTLLLAHSEVAVGPFRAEMSVSPSFSGGTEVDIPPLGSLHLDSHAGPIHLKVNLGSLDQQRTEALIDDPTAISAAGQSAVDDVARGVVKLALRALGASVVTSLLLAALVFRSSRRMAWSGMLSLAVTAGSMGLAAGTLRPDSISEPRYEGLLVNAPAVVGDARRIADNYGRYADQLAQIVSNVSRIYATVSSLPVYEPDATSTRILHVSDLHLNPASWDIIRTVVKQFDIDAVVDTGDIVDWGSSQEDAYVSEIPSVGVPYIYTRGNHDSVATEAAVRRQTNARVLDNTTTTVKGLTIAGIGDPEFTPDKSNEPAPEAGNADGSMPSPLVLAGSQLAVTVGAEHGRVDVAMVHDPAMAPPLSGTVPLVLAGHLHQRRVSILPKPDVPPAGSASPAPDGASDDIMATRLMVEGSTGGAGLRGLEKEEPTPIQMSVLYFDEQHQLKAYDDIELGGTGRSEVTLERKVIGHDPEPTTNPSVRNGVTPINPSTGTPD
ncbi:metallophosphoesterase [Actinoplanes sp. NPDC049265]|uniref:metallophosphoesterase family protein n=1 Tax=Actinoplanes sp. NPDC049265 TaxID=3363902 RepID=UPI003722D94E